MRGFVVKLLTPATRTPMYGYFGERVTEAPTLDLGAIMRISAYSAWENFMLIISGYLRLIRHIFTRSKQLTAPAQAGLKAAPTLRPMPGVNISWHRLILPLSTSGLSRLDSAGQPALELITPWSAGYATHIRLQSRKGN